MELKLRNISPQIIRAAIIAGVVLFTIILAAVLIIPRPGEVPAISQTTPQNEQDGVIPPTSILITFTRDLSEEEQGNITFSTQPTATLSPLWIAANTLQLTPLEDLSFATGYTVKVLYKGKEIRSFSFSTSDTTPEKFEEEIKQQAEGDELFRQAEADWYSDNSWYASFRSGGVVTEDFTIDYIPNTNKFRITIHLGPKALGAEINAAKNRSITALENTGASVTDTNHYFTVQYE